MISEAENENNTHNYELPLTIRQFTDPKYLDERKLQVFNADWDTEGVFFYQAYCDEIANYAIEQQRLGGQQWNPTRMSWIKPSFGWMLYRSGYGKKPRQERILRLKLPHSAVAHILSCCKLAHPGLDASTTSGGCGKVQWDPERDLHSPAPKGRLEPRKLPRTRAIQIGISGTLSEYYVANLISVEDVTDFAQEIHDGHGMMRSNNEKARQQGEEKMRTLQGSPMFPNERPYFPSCEKKHLVRLGMLPGESAKNLAHLGFGKASPPKGIRGRR